MNNLSNEQKARIFDLYPANTEIRKQGEYRPHSKNTRPKRYANASGGWQLVLNPISAISDADAIDIAKMYGGVRCHIDDGFIQVIDKDNYVPKYLLFSVDFPNQFSQFLIQRGYAVPLFIEPGHPDNGKTAIELGLAIAKTE